MNEAVRALRSAAPASSCTLSPFTSFAYGDAANNLRRMPLVIRALKKRAGSCRRKVVVWDMEMIPVESTADGTTLS